MHSLLVDAVRQSIVYIQTSRCLRRHTRCSSTSASPCFAHNPGRIYSTSVLACPLWARFCYQFGNTALHQGSTLAEGNFAAHNKLQPVGNHCQRVLEKAFHWILILRQLAASRTSMSPLFSNFHYSTLRRLVVIQGCFLQ